MNGLSNHKPNCQCGVCKAKRGEYKGKNNPMFGRHHSEKTKEKQSVAGVKGDKILRKDLKRYHKLKSKAGKKGGKLGGPIGGKLTIGQLQNSLKEFRKYYPELYHKQRVYSCRAAGKRTAELHPNNWQHAVKYLNKNSPFKYMGIGWHCSPIQRDITRLLFEQLGIVPIKGLNCQIYYNGGEHDFKFLGMIYEPHVLYTYGGTETREQYATRRRIAMNNNGHKNYELVVTTTFQEATQFITWLSKRVYTMSPTIKEELKHWKIK